MSYSELYHKLRNLEHESNVAAVVQKTTDAINTQLDSECYYPKEMVVRSADFGINYKINARCGRCYHCRETYKNEWFTRMWLETRARKYCYFVTLTYKSYKLEKNIPAQLRDAFFHYDNDNYTKSYEYSPCLCRLEHLQKFFFSLRYHLRSAGRYINFKHFSCCEYGTKYGRPHFHLILWNDEPITKADIQLAWSVCVDKKRSRYLTIGHVDFQDLVQLGTILSNPDAPLIMCDGKRTSCKSTFKYVAKYVTKSDNINYHRVYYALDWFCQLNNIEDANFIFNKRIYERINKNVTALPAWSVSSEIAVYFKELCQSELQRLQPLHKGTSLCVPFTFATLFRPSCTQSRAAGIGSDYVRENIDRMAKGLDKITDNVQGTLVFPHYFLRKTQEFLCGIQVKSANPPYSSFSKGLRENIYNHLHKLAEGQDPFSPTPRGVTLEHPFNLSDEKVNELIKSPYSLRDAYTCNYYLFHMLDDKCYFSTWQYCRSQRRYLHTPIIFPVSVLADKFLHDWHASQEFNRLLLHKSLENKVLENKCVKECDCLLGSTNGSSYRSLRMSLIDMRLFNNNYKQQLYEAQKNYVF